jgi:hypothetical protein
MTDERREPAIDHEFVVDLDIETDAEGGTAQLVLRVSSVREFTAFSYGLSVTDRSAPSKGSYALEIGGLSIPTVASGSASGARSILRYPMPADGTYELVVTRKAKRRIAAFTIKRGRPQTLANETGDGFVRFTIAST